MIGSIFYNCWGALIAFTIYFFATFQSYIPSRVLFGSFIAALITFFAMFLVRYFFGYVMYTPDHDIFEQFEEEIEEEVNEEVEMPTEEELSEPVEIVTEVKSEKTKVPFYVSMVGLATIFLGSFAYYLHWRRASK